ncbi:vitamin K epoxide reductase complex subunit 1 isoform X1 [Gallus gallus]|uniref:vitamin K epoxide reductase complex subunit 1 precursor n=1 Tax=Gallus gallus TaxID=9031 RepID=UPI001C9A1DBD|nr:vitamin K epoxide reductase complex subunit 1 precursor [Gallus gallus]XP_046790300.1 vitamin K epoxide reductase complex subunit 1 isoform X1 [Gallus gallus]
MAARAALCAVGLALAGYALHVERAHERDPTYRASCDLGPSVSCTRVFASRWGRGLGLLEAFVGRDSAINVPNSVIGIAFYSLQALLGAVPGRASSAALLVTSVTSVLASLYLALVLAFGLHDLCLVCLSTYVVNAALLFLNWRRWRRCGQTAVRKRE